MDLSTTYLGLKLRSPLVASASPISHEISGIRRLEDAGASAVVLYSLFEEQLQQEEADYGEQFDGTGENFAEPLNYLPRPGEFRTGADDYLNHIRKAKQSVDIPIIASLNGSTLGGWAKYAKQIEQAGADAVECNIYFIPANPDLLGSDVEKLYVDILREVKVAVHIPVAIKLSPFLSNLANMAKRLEQTGADGLVMFNRFCQPDINLDGMEVKPSVVLSSPQELLLPLTWIGLLYGRIKPSLAATTGVYEAEDVIKLLLAGADVTMMCSALLRKGVNHLNRVESGIREWMKEHEYSSVQRMRGILSQLRCTNPEAFERAQYMRSVKGLQHVQMTGKEAWRALTGE
jgi:dihydroorotate dehydrogenase (fumarate)